VTDASATQRPSSLLSESAETPTVLLSIIIPVFNEEGNVAPLYAEIVEACGRLGLSFEAIMVDDGSTDATFERAAAIADDDGRFKVVRLRRNFGQTAAMAAGFDHARGQVIVPMDGDLQNDPADIARLLAKLDDGYDVVSGWRVDRAERSLARTLPSKTANWVIGFVTGVRLHDFGCTLKATGPRWSRRHGSTVRCTASSRCSPTRSARRSRRSPSTTVHACTGGASTG